MCSTSKRRAACSSPPWQSSWRAGWRRQRPAVVGVAVDRAQQHVLLSACVQLPQAFKTASLHAAIPGCLCRMTVVQMSPSFHPSEPCLPSQWSVWLIARQGGRGEGFKGAPRRIAATSCTQNPAFSTGDGRRAQWRAWARIRVLFANVIEGQSVNQRTGNSASR